jgi:hypothetical protein
MELGNSLETIIINQIRKNVADEVFVLTQKKLKPDMFDAIYNPIWDDLRFYITERINEICVQ